MNSIAQYHAELQPEQYRYITAGLDTDVADGGAMTVIDPSGNQLTCVEEKKHDL